MFNDQLVLVAWSLIGHCGLVIVIVIANGDREVAKGANTAARFSAPLVRSTITRTTPRPRRDKMRRRFDPGRRMTAVPHDPADPQTPASQRERGRGRATRRGAVATSA
jgi:hypothetical protein